MATTYLVGFWNLENLFAPENHPDRLDWLARQLRSELEGWSDAVFQRKLDRLAEVIAWMNGGLGPDILGVCEVENEFVLSSLYERINAVLPNRQYQVAHVDSANDQRGIDTAFLYDSLRLTVDPDAIFTHYVMRRTGTRDITQVTFTTQLGNEFVAFANHWPSRKGSGSSDAYRRTAGETLGYFHERVREIRGKSMPVIAMGDFNDNPYDASLLEHAYATREWQDLARATAAWFYNLAWTYAEQEVINSAGKVKTAYGTHYFGGDGCLFDQILVSYPFIKKTSPLRVKMDSAQILAYPAMVSHRSRPEPIPFKRPSTTGFNPDGYSDHFPVGVVIEEH